MKLELFNKMITPILLYVSEVYGIYCLKEIDKLHIKFCKYVSKYVYKHIKFCKYVSKYVYKHQILLYMANKVDFLYI